ncbi:MAG: DNA-protecting protein DprA [Clostridia bacterium]|nr:DNA-protecting protein DprA [Clostridia bacterium]
MKGLEKKKYWIWLSLIPNLGSKKKQKLLELYKSPETIYYLKKYELAMVKELGEKVIENLMDSKRKEAVEKHIEYMDKNEIDIISIYDNEYPSILKEIYDPPISLYCKGDVTVLKQPGMGIVGCREVSEYGKKATKYFSYHLAQKGNNIISGLAKGVDCYAHVGAICGQLESDPQKDKSGNCGKTIAIVGNGLDIIYPRENEGVAKKIIETGGAIVSEFPIGTKPEKMNFPARNRIISGMSKGILVVEAKEKSGTLITVDYALEQGRDVFVVPGNINSIHSVGTNRLIQQGAKLVMNYTEIC